MKKNITAQQLLEKMKTHKGHILDVLQGLESEHITPEEAHHAISSLVRSHDLSLSELAELMSHIEMHGSHNATNEDQSPYDSGMNWPGQDSYIEMPTEKKRKRALKYGAAALGLGLAAPHAINVANAGLHAAPGAALGALKSVGSTLENPLNYTLD